MFVFGTLSPQLVFRSRTVQFKSPIFTMKMLVAFAALVAVASAATFAPVPHHNGDAHNVVLVKEVQHDNTGLGGYKYSYEQSDGQSRDEVSQVASFRNAETNEDSLVNRVQGSFNYVNPYDGQTYSVKYVADENGFRAEGAHIPV